jgi:hypothetical protein
MATVTLKLSNLDLIYVQLNALRRHLGLHPLNPKEYVLSVDGEVPENTPAPVVAPSSSIALVVPIITPSSPPEQYTDDEEEDEDEEDNEEPSSALVSPNVKLADTITHSWVSGF